MFKLLIIINLLCQPLATDRSRHEEPVVIQGHTMGTTYRIIYFDARRRNFKQHIDSLLRLVNKSISTYDRMSEISRFNKSERGICLELPYLYEILGYAKKIHRESGGAFDPSIMPLVNAWGFGPEKSIHPTREQIDSLQRLTGFKKVRLSRKRLIKKHPGLQLDLGGIGQGYGADVVFSFLRSQGIHNMLVELGGEGVALGMNLEKGKPWTIGILDPNSTPEHQFFKAYVTLHDQAFTTSGNYFNYKVEAGRKFGHTINPMSGYPVQHSLLSASVFAADCTTADGWATAFMVMGLEKAVDKLKSLKGIDVLFIYSNPSGELETFVSPGLQKNINLE